MKNEEPAAKPQAEGKGRRRNGRHDWRTPLAGVEKLPTGAKRVLAERLSPDASGIPLLGVGTWRLQGDACRAQVADALALGYDHFDTSPLFGNEEDVGRAIAESGADREELFLTSKLPGQGLDSASLRRRTEESLRRLRTEYLDLLLIHWPDGVETIEEILDAMLELRDRNRVHAIGVRESTPSRVEYAAAWTTELSCAQAEYHPLMSRRTLLGVLRERGLALIACSPLARGELVHHPELKRIGREHGRSAAQVALRWLLQQPGVRAIPRATSRAHLEENLRSLDFELEDAEMDAIGALGEQQRDVRRSRRVRSER